MALIVGIDLGRKSAHDVVMLRRETGRRPHLPAGHPAYLSHRDPGVPRRCRALPQLLSVRAENR